MIETAQALIKQVAAQTNDVIVIPPAQETKIENQETKQNEGVSQETTRENVVTEAPKPEAVKRGYVPNTTDESDRNVPPYKISDDQAEEADQLWKRVWEARNNEWSRKNHFGASFKTKFNRNTTY